MILFFKPNTYYRS